MGATGKEHPCGSYCVAQKRNLSFAAICRQGCQINPGIVPLRQPSLAGPGAAVTSGPCPHNEIILKRCCELTAKFVCALRGKHAQHAAMLTELTRDGKVNFRSTPRKALNSRQGASQANDRQEQKHQRDLKHVDRNRVSWPANTDTACCETAGIATHRSIHI